jgi:GT2 family glycosyltransferase
VTEVSVVVATHDPGPSLAGCLAALEAQTSVRALEVIVIDDGSPHREAVAEALRPFPRVKLVRQDRRGVAAARNTGARTARGSIVCFTDDDCAPEPEWAHLLAEMVRGGIDVGGGVTLPGSPRNRYDAATQTLVNALADPRSGGPLFLPGSNFACRRDVLLAVPFDERFGGAGEDREWCNRLVRLGYRLGWEESAVVRHYQELDVRRFWEKHCHYGRGVYSLMRSQGSGQPLGPPARYRHIVRKSLEGGPAVGLLVCLAQVATAVGFVLEMAGDRLDRRPPTG